MVNISIEGDCISIDGVLIPKETLTIVRIFNGIKIQDDFRYSLNLNFRTTTLNGIQPASNDEIFDFLKAYSFSGDAPEVVELFDDLNRLVSNGILINVQTYNLSI